MRLLTGIFLSMILFFVICLNLRLYYTSNYSVIQGSLVNEDLLAELRTLRSSMENEAAVDMQNLFPEGYLFMNALYGLSWCEVASAVSHSSDLYKEAHREIQRSYESVDSDVARSLFEDYLPLPYGAYYIGWTNYFLGRKLLVEDPGSRKVKEINAFQERCELIAKVLYQNNSPYPASYRGGAWPADVVMCIASLAQHDKLFKPRYQETIREWLRKVKGNLDTNGLIPHSVDIKTGSPLEGARGSSQSLILVLLHEIDADFARQQFQLYKKLFLDYRFGLPGIREYPKGTSGSGDVDSGPVIFQMGGAATIVGIQTMHVYGEEQTSLALRNGIEAFGAPISLFERKQYLFGLLPMADAFIIWTHSRCNLRDEASISDSTWRYTFHMYSLMPIALILLLLARNMDWLRHRRTPTS